MKTAGVSVAARGRAGEDAGLAGVRVDQVGPQPADQAGDGPEDAGIGHRVRLADERRDVDLVHDVPGGVRQPPGRAAEVD